MIYDIHGIGVYRHERRVTFWDDAYESEIVELATSRRREFPNRAVDRDRVFLIQLVHRSHDETR